MERIDGTDSAILSQAKRSRSTTGWDRKNVTHLFSPTLVSVVRSRRGRSALRYLLEQHNLGDGLFHCVNAYLEENGMKVARGTIVDATIINAPSSTKNKDKVGDPEMHQTKKGNQWYFGMKAHIGVDSKNKLIHSVAATAATVHDSQVLEDLLHGEETRVYGDSAYANQKEVLKAHAPDAKDFTNQKGARNNPLTEIDKSKNTTKSRTRARVEHLFHTLKCRFGYTKVRYRGLNKNANHLFSACALVNLVTAKKHLLGAV